jgi:chromosome partitioning protein
MKIVTLINNKGGCGKSTLAAHMACEAELKDFHNVALIDLNENGSLEYWYKKRSRYSPVYNKIKCENLKNRVEINKENHVDLTIVDTSEFQDENIEYLCKNSDLILIPSKASGFDIKEVLSVSEFLKKIDRKGIVVFNQISPNSSINQKFIRKLKQNSIKISPCSIKNRVVFSKSTSMGLVAYEVEYKGKGSREITELWKWIFNILNIP